MKGFFFISQENIECSFESVATSPDPVVAVFDRAAQGVVSQFISWYTLHRVTFTSEALSVIGECTEYRSSLEVSTRECQDQALEWGMGEGEVGEREGGREGEAFKEMWRTNYLSAKNALCPSKNSFDRIFWQAPAAQLFQALSGMCWCYFQTRGSTLDLRSEQKGLLWILDEESIFPGANDSSFLARLYVHHCNDSEYKIIHHSSNVCGLWEMPD